MFQNILTYDYTSYIEDAEKNYYIWKNRERKAAGEKGKDGGW